MIDLGFILAILALSLACVNIGFHLGRAAGREEMARAVRAVGREMGKEMGREAFREALEVVQGLRDGES
jgi:hypothetical protein